MKIQAVLLLAVACLAGCSTYRVTSNIPAAGVAQRPAGPVLLLQEAPSNRAYEELGPIEVTVRKGSPFVSAPTQQQADVALIQKARDMGAAAVIRIHYQDGFDIISWGHIKATGVGVRFTD